MKKVKKSLFFALCILSAFFIFSSLPYYKSRVYIFPEPIPFSGDMFYNPYKNIEKQWVKANFHAHSILHRGLANGENTPQELFTVYDSMNYQVACISNYNNILPDSYGVPCYISVYEHGLNTGAVHQLVINNKEVKPSDFPYYQTLHHKQQVLFEQKNDSNLVSINHPVFKKGYSLHDVKYLSNYDLFEGVSVRSTSIERWDEALSNGHTVWIIGNDDSHNTRFGTCGICWTMVNVDSISKSEVLKNLKKGSAYATRGWVGQEMHRIKKVSVDSNWYELELENKSDSILLKSDKGKTVAFVTNSNKISYQIKDEDSYIRAEIFDSEEWNTYTKSYLNPVVRTTDGNQPGTVKTLEVNHLKTWLGRMIVFGLHICWIIILIAGYRKLFIKKAS